MLVCELSEEIFDECGVAQKNYYSYNDVPFPTYAGFFKGFLLVMEVDTEDTDTIIFWGECAWNRDEDLKKYLILFYVEKGIYPSFMEGDKKLFMKLSKI